MGKTYVLDLVVEEKKTSPKGALPDKAPAHKGLAQQGTEQCACAEKSKSKQKVKQKKSTSDSSDSDSEDECCNLETLEDIWRYPMYSPSASYRQVHVVSGSHQYTISGFPLARSMGCGTRLCSDFFEICGQLFRLEVYPGGFTADTRRFVSVFLTTPGTLNPNHVMYEIAILDQSGKDRHIVEKRGSQGHGGFGGRMCAMFGPMLSCSRGVLAALPKFIKAKFLEEHHQRYMPCGMLVLRATVQVLRGWSSAPMVHGHMAYNAVGGRPMLPGAMGLLPRQYPMDVGSPYMPMQQLPLGYPPGHLPGPVGCACGARHPQQQQYQPGITSPVPAAAGQYNGPAQQYTGFPGAQASGTQQQGMQFRSSQPPGSEQGGMGAPHYPQFTPQSTPQSRAQPAPQWYSAAQQQQPSAPPHQQPSAAQQQQQQQQQQQHTYQPAPNQQQYVQQRTAHSGHGGGGGGPAGPQLSPHTPVALMRETDPRYLVYLASPSPGSSA